LTGRSGDGDLTTGTNSNLTLALSDLMGVIGCQHHLTNNSGVLVRRR